MAAYLGEQVTVHVSPEFLERAREAGTYAKVVRALKSGVYMASRGDADALLDHLVRPCLALLVGGRGPLG